MSATLIPLMLMAAPGVQEAVDIAPAMPVRPSIDWAALPDIAFREPPQLTPAMHAYVAAQARARRCRLRRTVDGRPAIRVEVAVLVHPELGARTSIPRAIGCPQVEQYAAGLVTSFTRNNLAGRTGGNEQWYRATLTFIWKR